MGIVVSVMITLSLMIPFHYIVKDINNANENNFEYLAKGQEYTVNAVVSEDIMNWIVSAPVEIVEEETPEVTE